MEIFECKSMEKYDFAGISEAELQDSAGDGEDYKLFNTYRFGLYRKLTGIRLKSHNVVDSIQFVYDKNDCTGVYGGNGGTLNEFTLKDGEFITQIDWTTGLYEGNPIPVVACITFQTNLGRKFSGGQETTCRDTKKHSQQVPNGYCYYSFGGRYERFFMGFDVLYYRPINLSTFDDTLFAENKSRITEIRLNTGWVVDGIQVVYDGDKEAHYHGGTGGSRTTFKLQNDEYIISISGKIGKYQYQDYNTLCCVEIRTNKGRSISGGSTKGCSNMKDFSYSANNGEQIFSLCGSYHGYMREIAVSSCIPV